MNRGSQLRRTAFYATANPFNEAPIHESGKYAAWAEFVGVLELLQ